MSSKPIIFNTEMVKAILDGRKTQTRRAILKDFMKIEIEKDIFPQEVKFDRFKDYCPCLNFKDNGNAVFQLINRSIKPLPFCDGICTEIDIKLKYKVGDVLWVREPAKVIEINDYQDCFTFKYLADNKEETLSYLDKWENKDGMTVPRWVENCQGVPNGCIKEMARIFLKVTNVKFERLQYIGNKDLKFVFVYEFERIEKQ